MGTNKGLTYMDKLRYFVVIMMYCTSSAIQL